MKEKFITDTLQERISNNLNYLHATKARGGWYMKAMHVQVIVVKIRYIVVKNTDVSSVGIGNFCRCAD